MVMLLNPVSVPLPDGFRCLLRYKRVWLTFVLLGFAYFVFQFSTFTPIQSTADFDLAQITSLATWHWPTFLEAWQGPPTSAPPGIPGLFHGAPTTHPFSAHHAPSMFVHLLGLSVVLAL